MRTFTTTFEGPHALYLWNNIKDHVYLVEEIRDELRQAFHYSDEARARLLTFFQILAFGNNSRHGEELDSKLTRNRALVDVDSAIVGIAKRRSKQPCYHALVLKLDDSTRIRIFLGESLGASVVYPLNDSGTDHWVNNQLPPHEFKACHLRPRESGYAEGAFLGAAIYLPLIRRLLRGQLLGKNGFGELGREIANQVLEFLPPLELRDDHDDLRLETQSGQPMPKIFTVFGGRGQGEEFVGNIGLVGDPSHSLEAETGERRYVLDFEDFNKEGTEPERKARILDGWAWFLHWSDRLPNQVLSTQFRKAATLIRASQRS